MATRIRHLRPVLTLREHDYGTVLGKVLSPSQPLQSEEYLRGRVDQLSGIKKALYSPGRHVLIHGFRGVGKSSLAQTAAFAISEGGDPVLVACDKKSTFTSVLTDIASEVCDKNPRLEKRVKESRIGLSLFGAEADYKETVQEGAPTQPTSVNEAVRLIDIICQNDGFKPVVVIDEFDQLENKDEQQYFALFIKQLSDKHVPARFIFCGIGESIDAIMAAHESADRYFHTVSLGRLPWEARFDIVNVAAEALGVEIDFDTVIRIARISDGFPHYVHFISEKLFWRVYEARNDGSVTPELFSQAMSDAASSMEIRLRGPYEMATQKYHGDYEEVLWAAADGHELQRRSTSIYQSYVRIMGQRKHKPLDREHFNARINSLKQPSHASILTGTRQGWYEFTEKVVRGYVRLRAEQQGVVLEADHPAVIGGKLCDLSAHRD